MSKFEVPLTQVTGIQPIEGADRIELATVFGFQSIVGKGQYKVGDRVAYIPEGSVLPSDLIEEMGLTGKLAGAEKNRVKAIKMKGCLSQGLLYPENKIPDDGYKGLWDIGQDLSEQLSITKYEPKLPSALQGKARPLGNMYGTTLKYDIENVKKNNGVLEEGEHVYVTEKIHGTNVQIGLLPDGTSYVTSKGLGARGFVLEDDGNVYVSLEREYGILEKLKKYYTDPSGLFPHFVIFGEIYGKSIQDLTYASRPSFAAFDVWCNGEYLTPFNLAKFAKEIGFPLVPLLYNGPYNKELVEELATGNETVSGTEAHVREGVVVTPEIERTDRHGERVKYKVINPAYLLRKNEDATEFE